jgi:hypothetical protein
MNLTGDRKDISLSEVLFINPAVIHDATLVCKFIKEAMFLREHPSVDQN